VALFQGLLELS
jgi:hypothetical protein